MKSRGEMVRELVKDPSLRVTDIAKQTGYNKGHVSRLRKEAKGQHMSENKSAKKPSDGGAGFIDGVWYGPGPTAWQCQCGKAYTVTCISSKPAKREWVGLTKEDMPDGDNPMFDTDEFYAGMAWAEAKLKEKNHG